MPVLLGGTRDKKNDSYSCCVLKTPHTAPMASAAAALPLAQDPSVLSPWLGDAQGKVGGSAAANSGFFSSCHLFPRETFSVHGDLPIFSWTSVARMAAHHLPLQTFTT